MEKGTMENQILAEAKIVTKNYGLKHEDILGWSTSSMTLAKDGKEGEKILRLPQIGVNIVVMKKDIKK